MNPNLKRRVEALDGREDRVKYEDCVLALDSPDPDAAFAKLRRRYSPKAWAEFADAIRQVESGSSP